MHTSDLNAAARRGHNPGLSLYSFTDECWTHCPACDQTALIIQSEKTRHLGTAVGKYELWALNLEHIAYPAGLPHWMKKAKSRAAAIAALKQLETMGSDCQ